MRRQTRKTNRNEIAMCIGATVFGLVIVGAGFMIMVANYAAWANQFHS